jgi:hypothetical protein
MIVRKPDSGYTIGTIRKLKVKAAARLQIHSLDGAQYHPRKKGFR